MLVDAELELIGETVSADGRGTNGGFSLLSVLAELYEDCEELLLTFMGV